MDKPPRNLSCSPYGPISQISHDALGFSKITPLLKSAIINLESNDSWVLGIDGEWGSGKSSFLNLLINSITSDTGLSPRPIIVHFEPWLVNDRNSLISNFFRRLSDAIGDVSTSELSIFSPKRWKIWLLRLRLRNTFSRISKKISGAGFLSSLSIFDISLGVIFGFLRLFSTEPSLEKQKLQATRIIQELLKVRPNTKIIVTIDDLDRLEPEEAVEVLRLVKAVANFPSIIYVLAYDRKVLAKAVETAANVTDGNAYLEKIVQFGYKMPTPGPFSIRQFFKQKLISTFPEDADWSSYRATIVLDTWAGRLIKTPRDAVRIFESIAIMWRPLKDRADLLDLIWIEMLKEQASSDNIDLYSWVLSYITSLEALAIGGRVSGKHRMQNELIEILANLNWKRDEDGDGTGEWDFHHLKDLLVGVTEISVPRENRPGRDNDLWIFKTSNSDIREASDAKRLSSPWHWQLYVAFSQPESALTDDTWLRLKELADTQNDTLFASIKTTMEFSPKNAGTLGDQLLDRIRMEFERNQQQSQENWLLAVIDAADSIYSRCSSRGWGYGNFLDLGIERLFRMELKRRSDTNDRSSLLEKVFKSGKSMWAVSEIFRSEYFRFNPSPDGERKTPSLTQEEFTQVTKWYKTRLAETTPQDIKSAPDAWSIIYGAKNAMGDENVGVWFESRIPSEADLIVVCEGLETIKSSAQSEKGIPNKWLGHITDADAIKIRLRAIARDGSEISVKADQILSRWYMDDRWE